MLPLFNSLLAQIIVLALLCVLLAAPFLGLWIALSIRRALWRLSDSQSRIARYADSMLADDELRERIANREADRRISNSAFGR